MHENREISSPTARQRSSPAGKGASRKSSTNGGEKSDGVVVPMKSSNKSTEPQAGAAERVEGSTPAKENINQTNTFLTQDRRDVSQGLVGVRQALTLFIHGKSRMR